MSQQFTYAFTADGFTSDLTVTVDSTATNDGNGIGYDVTAISGSFDGQTITGMFGSAGSPQLDANGNPYDNVIFTADDQGVNGSSSDGIDGVGLDFTAGGHDYNIFSYGSDLFSFLTDDNVAGPVTLVSTNAPCYCRGTSILTTGGEVAVEDLTLGDLVVTASGETRPIRWIGWREIDCAAHPEPAKVWPVRVAAGAIGPGAPARDLRVSPGHHLFFDDVLVPANLLVNGSTIAQERVDRIGYWHIELDRHDLLLAEGVAAESYLECGNRASFANGGAVVALHADFAARGPDADAVWAEFGCAPRCLSGPKLARLQKWLASRAERLGARTTPDPGVRVLADGEPLTPVSVVDRCFRFDVPQGTQTLRLHARVVAPAELPHLDSFDTRRLGVKTLRLEVDGREVGLDDPRLSDGWFGVESNATDRWRWSTGDAALPVGRKVAIWFCALSSYPLPWRRPPTPTAAKVPARA